MSSSSSPPSLSPRAISQLRRQLHQSIFSTSLNCTSVSPTFVAKTNEPGKPAQPSPQKTNQKPLPVSLLLPDEFALLSPIERQQLKRNVKNFASIASTLAAAPSRQTNLHGTYLEPLLDHHNSKLHPSPGPGQYFEQNKITTGNVDHQEESPRCDTNDKHEIAMTVTSSPKRAKIPPLYPDSASKFCDDVTRKKMIPGPAFYLGFEHISTIEVTQQGAKKRAENVLLLSNKNNNNNNNTINIIHQTELEKLRVADQDEKVKKAKTQNKNKNSQQEDDDKKNQKQLQPSIFMEKVIQEEKQRREHHSLSHHPNSQNIGVSFASRNQEFHRGVMANVSNLHTAAPGCYETIYSDRTISGRMNKNFKKMSSHHQQQHIKRMIGNESEKKDVVV